MALPATDSFTGTTGDALSTYSSNWDTFDDHYIQSNACGADRNIGNHGTSTWNADTFSDDGYSEADVGNLGTIGRNGVGYRMGTTTARQDYYGVYFDSAPSLELFSDVGGTKGTLSTSGTDASGSRLRLECEGTTITVLLDGSTTGAPAAQTDTDHSSGVAGLVCYSRDAFCTLDNWEAGDLSAGPAAAEINRTPSNLDAWKQGVQIITP